MTIPGLSDPWEPEGERMGFAQAPAWLAFLETPLGRTATVAECQALAACSWTAEILAHAQPVFFEVVLRDLRQARDSA